MLITHALGGCGGAAIGGRISILLQISASRREPIIRLQASQARRRKCVRYKSDHDEVMDAMLLELPGYDVAPAEMRTESESATPRSVFESLSRPSRLLDRRNVLPSSYRRPITVMHRIRTSCVTARLSLNGGNTFRAYCEPLKLSLRAVTRRSMRFS